jgi:hypothetical protein
MAEENSEPKAIELMAWTWADPLRGLVHNVNRIHARVYGGPFRVAYLTKCGISMSVDDVNKKTMLTKTPNCMSCVVE